MRNSIRNSCFSFCGCWRCFSSLVGIPIAITGSATGIKICAITAGITKYKSITEKKKNKHDKIVLLARTTLNSMEVLIFRGLIDSNVSHVKFALINVLKEYDGMKQEINNLKTSSANWEF